MLAITVASSPLVSSDGDLGGDETDELILFDVACGDDMLLISGVLDRLLFPLTCSIVLGFVEFFILEVVDLAKGSLG